MGEVGSDDEDGSEIKQLRRRVLELEKNQIKMTINDLGLSVILFRFINIVYKIKLGKLELEDLVSAEESVKGLYEDINTMARRLAGNE